MGESSLLGREKQGKVRKGLVFGCIEGIRLPQ